MKYALIVAAMIEKNGWYLFGKKSKDIDPYPNCWLIIGGKVYPEKETLEASLQREIKEEANIEVKDIKKIGFDEDYRVRKGEMTHLIFLIYSVKYKSGEVKPGDDIEKLKWVKKSAIKKLKLAPPTIKLLKYLRWI